MEVPPLNLTRPPLPAIKWVKLTVMLGRPEPVSTLSTLQVMEVDPLLPSTCGLIVRPPQRLGVPRPKLLVEQVELVTEIKPLCRKRLVVRS